jgi:transposase
MIAYTLDLRQRIIDAVEQNIYSKCEIAEIFGIHESFIYKLLRQRRERGDIAPLPHGGGAKSKLTALSSRLRLPVQQCYTFRHTHPTSIQ